MENYFKINYKGGAVSMIQDKANCLSTQGFHGQMDLICVAQRGRAYRGETAKFEEAPNEGKTNCLTTVGKDNLILQRPRGYNHGGVFVEKSPTVSANAFEQNNLVVMKDNIRVRRLTPTECARLQTIPQWYKWGVSETQQYKMLGNGWTVEVIKHILSFLPDSVKYKSL